MKKVIISFVILAFASIAFAGNGKSSSSGTGQTTSRNTNYSGQTTQSSSSTGYHTIDMGSGSTYVRTGEGGAPRDTGSYDTSPSSGSINSTYKDTSDAINSSTYQ